MPEATMLAGKVLCIDDDRLVALSLEKIVPLPVIAYPTIGGFLGALTKGQPHGIFLDIHLNEETNGLDFLQAVQSRFPSAPVLVMTSAPESSWITAALEKGAADFVRKPLKIDEVTSRLAKCRADYLARSVISFADVVMDLSRSELRGPAGSEHITHKESLLLAALLRSPALELTRDELIGQIWGETKVCSNSLEQYLKKTRGHLAQVTTNCTLVTHRSESIELVLNRTADHAQIGAA